MNIANVKVGHVIACATGCKPITSGMVGVTVTFEYDDPVWNGLHKTAVFTAGRVTRDVLNADSEVIVPAEVLQKAGERLYVGVYGTDDDGKLVIPTIMTQVGVILPGADPSGDPGTDPELPIWAQLQADVEALKHGGTGGGSISVTDDGDALIITTSLPVSTDGDAIVIGGT